VHRVTSASPCAQIDVFSVSRLTEFIASAGLRHDDIYEKPELRVRAKQAAALLRGDPPANPTSGWGGAPPPGWDPTMDPSIPPPPEPADPYYVAGAGKGPFVPTADHVTCRFALRLAELHCAPRAQ
jgi:hypothetical protein